MRRLRREMPEKDYLIAEMTASSFASDRKRLAKELACFSDKKKMARFTVSFRNAGNL